MKFTFKSHTRLNSFVLAGLLATAGASAMAQNTPSAPAAGPASAAQPSGPPGARMDHHNPAKMQAMMAKRQADMKAKLMITPSQESAWTSFTAAMQPPAHTRPTPEQRAELDKLTTPQRIDKMREVRVQRMTEMTASMGKRDEATKTFYAALTPEQQKTFDAEHKKHRGLDGNTHHRGQGGHDGPGMKKG